jgi:hypothetical protein
MRLKQLKHLEHTGATYVTSRKKMIATYILETDETFEQMIATCL